MKIILFVLTRGKSLVFLDKFSILEIRESPNVF